MKEYAKNYYRSVYKAEDKETLIERIFDLEEQVNKQQSVLVDSQWISKYSQVNDKIYCLKADLISQNQLLKRELEYQKIENINLIKELTNMKEQLDLLKDSYKNLEDEYLGR